jgi:uncharacterized protein YecE (DUF72 family)
MATGRIRIGLSGWAYKHWRGDFYPPELRQADELSYAAARFPTLEINRTFYSLVEPRNMSDWRDRVPRDFRFAVKGSRFITHNKKLSDIEKPMARFLASGLVELEEKLGPILWQLAPNLRFNRDRVEQFMAALPRKLGNRRLRHVIEPRHESFFAPDLARMARDHNVAIALSHSSGWPFTEELTAGFVYIRLHGPRALYSSAYSQRELEGWAHRIKVWAAGNEPNDARRLTDLEPPPRKRRDVYVYFDNDSGGHAPRQAMNLIRLLGSAQTKG